jgi:hypothetical protein
MSGFRRPFRSQCLPFHQETNKPAYQSFLCFLIVKPFSIPVPVFHGFGNTGIQPADCRSRARSLHPMRRNRAIGSTGHHSRRSRSGTRRFGQARRPQGPVDILHAFERAVIFVGLTPCRRTIRAAYSSCRVVHETTIGSPQTARI